MMMDSKRINKSRNRKLCTTSKFSTILFVANGGNGVVPKSIVNKNEDQIILPKPTGLHRQGYQFKYWSSSCDGSRNEFYPGELYEFHSDTILYAVYERLYSIKYKLNLPQGCKEMNLTFDQKGYSKGSIVEVSLPKELYEVEEYYFLGWAKRQKNPLFLYDEIDTALTMDSNITLFGQWVKRIPFTIEYDCSAYESYGIHCPVDEQVYHIGDSIPIKDLALNEIEIKQDNEKAIFYSWEYKSPILDKKFSPFHLEVIKDVRMISPDHKLKLTLSEHSWSKQTKSFDTRVSYDANVQDCKVTNIPSVQLESSYGEKAFYISDEIPHRDGYLFLGWSLDPKKTTKFYYPYDKVKCEKNNCKFYAIWEKADKEKKNFTKVSLNLADTTYDFIYPRKGKIFPCEFISMIQEKVVKEILIEQFDEEPIEREIEEYTTFSRYSLINEKSDVMNIYDEFDLPNQDTYAIEAVTKSYNAHFKVLKYGSLNTMNSESIEYIGMPLSNLPEVFCDFGYQMKGWYIEPIMDYWPIEEYTKSNTVKHKPVFIEADRDLQDIRIDRTLFYPERNSISDDRVTLLAVNFIAILKPVVKSLIK